MNCTIGCARQTLAPLGNYKAPKIIKFAGELPKRPSGKVRRLKLLDN